MEKAKIRFYRVKRCGYYQPGQSKPDFGTLNEIVGELISWTKGKELGLTCPYEVEEGDQFLGTYCFGLTNNQQNSDSLLVTWNQVPSTGNHIASVDASAKVGSADVKMTKTPGNSIPGFATYFWLIPEHKALATICFQHPLNGHQGFQKFMKEFIAKFTAFTVYKPDRARGTTDILGYRESSSDNIAYRIPSFRSVPAQKPGKVNFIKKNQSKIVRILRKNALNPHGTNGRPSLRQAFREDLGLPANGTAFETSHVHYEVAHCPTATELDTIMNTWSTEYDTKWDDVGFKLTNDPQVYWLSHSLVKQELDLDVRRDNEETINAESLLQALENRRTELLRGL